MPGKINQAAAVKGIMNPNVKRKFFCIKLDLLRNKGANKKEFNLLITDSPKLNPLLNSFDLL